MPTTRKKTAYMKLRTAKKNLCLGKISMADFNTAATAYKNDAVAKGKSATDANAVVTKVKNAGCTIAVSGARRRKAPTAAPRRRRAK